MVLNTKSLYAGLSFISTIKNFKSGTSLCNFFSKENNLYVGAESSNGYFLQSKIGDNITEDIHFCIDIEKIISLIRPCKKEEVELIVRPNNIVLKTESDNILGLFSNKVSASILTIQEGEEENINVEVDYSKFLKALSSYCETTHKTDINYNMVFCKDILLSFNGGVLRKTKPFLNFKYPLMITSEMTSFLDFMNAEGIICSFNKKGYSFCNGTLMAFIYHQPEYIKIFEKEVIPYPLSEEIISCESYVKISSCVLTDLSKNYKFFLKKSNGAFLLNLKNNEIIIDNERDKITIPDVILENTLTIDSVNLNIFRLLPLISFCDDPITMYLKSDSKAFYLNNDTEIIVFTVQ
jgi:hypothetical protein